MALKRPSGAGEEEGFSLANHEAKRRFTSSNLAQNLICGISSEELALTLETVIRRCVRDEVQRCCQTFFSTLPRSLEATEPIRKTSLQLRFQGNLPNTFFTGSNIESEDNTSLKLVLFDVDSNKIVSSGALSSLKIEIVPLDGDFCVDEDQDWSEKEFDAKIICARDGRRPLITGNLVLTLENGVADVNELCFTDNSSWRRSRKFMIGARVKEASGRVRVREARSQAFIVKDHRGESYKKHHPPCLGDEIWRLEKIAKDGVFHKRLASHRISSVKDFLQMYNTNQSLLRKLLGGSSNKTWETIIKHAKSCVLDETPMVESIKQEVYRNLNGMVPMDDLSAYGVPIPVGNLQNYPPKCASLGLPCLDIPVNEVEMQMYGEVGSSSSEEEFNMGQDSCPMEDFSPNLRNSFKAKEFMNGGYGDDVNFQSLWQGDELYIDGNNQSVDIGVCISRIIGSPRARWCKIRAALKWGSVRRRVAVKRMARLPSYLDYLV